MKGYTFIYGVDGFGADVAPAYEQGIFLDYNKAYKHLKELTKQCLNNNTTHVFYEKGYGEDFFPANNKILQQAEEKEDWNTYDEEMNKHIFTNIDDICKTLINIENPPFGFYAMVEVKII